MTTTITQSSPRTATRPRLAVLIGSVRADRFGPVPAAWFAQQAREHAALEVEVVDLADYDLSVSLSAGDDVAALGARLAEADAFAVVTPEYNHSFPAGLKSAIDHFHQEWRAKPVAFVSYGGMAGGLRAVEQLRQVFAELHAVTVRDTLSFHNFWGTFDDDGQPVDGAANTAAKQLLDQLTWWAVSLREARDKRPYLN
ncbi:NADPH-dependent FMN reductase [Saccharomonospora azurea]|uniref:Flavoprotein n=2 Tax=Saccharomonospora azurea TaxID=40988 RepID=H8G881_9PSEU|nr:NAD(P)H-dependent oxidoreductase [Saccharomonospora azurea]EHY89433.1 putative flavoprotein [Saccharomonospora azurea NA-128]